MVPMHLARWLLASAGLYLFHASADEDVEAIHERLEALDAERSTLHHRLARATGGRKEKEAALVDDGLEGVLERLVLGLAPLLPELGLELMMLACAGVLVYAVAAFRSQSGFSRSQTKSLKVSSVSVAVTCIEGCSIDQAEHHSITSRKYGAANESGSEKIASQIGPPPGLSLDLDDDCVVVPPIALLSESEATDHDTEIDVAPPRLPEVKSDTHEVDSGLSEVGMEHRDSLEHVAIALQASEVDLEPPVSLEPSISSHTSEATGKEAELASATEERHPEVVVVGGPAKGERSTKAQKRTMRDVSKKSKGETPAKEFARGCQQLQTVNPESCRGVTDVGVEEASQQTQSHAWFADYPLSHLPRFLRRHQELIDEEFNIALDTHVSKKRAETGCSDKANKKKGKQQQHKTVSPKQVRDNKCTQSRLISKRPQWPCSLPFTAAVLIMFIVILLGHITPTTDIAREALAEKKQRLEELQIKSSALRHKMAMLELQKFAANAQHAISILPVAHTKKLEDLKADAQKLHEAFQEVPEADFHQVEESFNTVLAGWKRSLSDVQRLASLSSADKESQCRSKEE